MPLKVLLIGFFNSWASYEKIKKHNFDYWNNNQRGFAYCCISKSGFISFLEYFKRHKNYPAYFNDSFVSF